MNIIDTESLTEIPVIVGRYISNFKVHIYDDFLACELQPWCQSEMTQLK